MTAQFCGQSKTDQSQPKDQSQPDKPLGEVPKIRYKDVLTMFLTDEEAVCIRYFSLSSSSET